METPRRSQIGEIIRLHSLIEIPGSRAHGIQEVESPFKGDQACQAGHTFQPAPMDMGSFRDKGVDPLDTSRVEAEDSLAAEEGGLFPGPTWPTDEDLRGRVKKAKLMLRGEEVRTKPTLREAGGSTKDSDWTVGGRLLRFTEMWKNEGE